MEYDSERNLYTAINAYFAMNAIGAILSIGQLKLGIKYRDIQNPFFGHVPN